MNINKKSIGSREICKINANNKNGQRGWWRREIWKKMLWKKSKNNWDKSIKLDERKQKKKEKGERLNTEKLIANMYLRKKINGEKRKKNI